MLLGLFIWCLACGLFVVGFLDLLISGLVLFVVVLFCVAVA